MPLLLLAGACSGDDNKAAVRIEEDASSTTTTAEPTTTTEAPDDASANAEEYLRRIDSLDPEVVASASELAAPGSPALAYVQFQAAQTRAVVNSGSPTNGVESTVEVQDDGSIENCTSDGLGNSQCTSFADFVATPAGLLQTMTVEGNQLDGRVIGTTGAMVKAVNGATVTLLGALQYNSQVGLGVAIEVRAGSNAISPPGPSGSSYVDPSGQQFEGSFDASYYASNDVQPDALTVAVLGFNGGTLGGGRLTFDICTADFSSCVPVILEVG